MKYVLIITVCILALPLVQGTVEVDYQGERLEFQLTIEDACTPTPNAFRIERLNHYTGIEPLTITYTLEQNNYTETISRTINRFTGTGTGTYKATNSTVYIHIENTTLTWENTCGVEEEIIITCPQEFIVETNENIFLPREQVRLYFSSDTSNNYEIDYGIETLHGTIRKPYLTTTNMQPKHYTIPASLQEEALIIRATLQENDCPPLTTTKVIGIQQENEEEKQEEAHISLRTEHTTQGIRVHLKPEHMTQITNLRIRDMNGTTITQPLRIRPTGEVELEIPTTNYPALVRVQAHSRDHFIEEYVHIPQEEKSTTLNLIRTYTRQQYVDETLRWYVRVNSQGAHAIKVETPLENQTQFFQTGKEHTVAFHLQAQTELNITTYLKNEEEIKKNTTTLYLQERAAPVLVPRENLSTITPLPTGRVVEEINAPGSNPWPVLGGFLALGGLIFLIRKKGL